MAFQTCQAALGNPSTALTVLESKPGVSVQGQAIMGPMTTPQHGLTCKSTRTAWTRIPSALATVGTSCRLIEKTRKDQYEQYEQYEMGFYDPENAAPALGASTVSNLLKTPLIILYRTAVTAVDLL